MRDNRTISNTSPEEIAKILSEAEERKKKAWKKPTLCAAPKCKIMFTPSREWQKYCSPGCQRAITYERAQRAQAEPLAELVRALRRVEDLEKEVAALKAENAELKGKL